MSFLRGTFRNWSRTFPVSDMRFLTCWAIVNLLTARTPPAARPLEMNQTRQTNTKRRGEVKMQITHVRIGDPKHLPPSPNRTEAKSVSSACLRSSSPCRVRRGELRPDPKATAGEKTCRHRSSTPAVCIGFHVRRKTHCDVWERWCRVWTDTCRSSLRTASQTGYRKRTGTAPRGCLS